MSGELLCYRCGESLAALTPPLGRHDECPACTAQVHVCAMCACFDPNVPKQCAEDDAEEVFEKERANFCDWFQPASDAFTGERVVAEQQARSSLDVLFGGDEPENAGQDLHGSAAEDLFK
jgi:hypothetical protein